MCVGSLAGVTYLRKTVLMSANKDETTVHCCELFLPSLVSHVFHVVSALQFIVCLILTLYASNKYNLERVTFHRAREFC